MRIRPNAGTTFAPAGKRILSRNGRGCVIRETGWDASLCACLRGDQNTAVHKGTRLERPTGSGLPASHLPMQLKQVAVIAPEWVSASVNPAPARSCGCHWMTIRAVIIVARGVTLTSNYISDLLETDAVALPCGEQH